MADKDKTVVRQIHGLERKGKGSQDLFTGHLRMPRGSTVRAVVVADSEDHIHVHADKMPPRTPIDVYNVRVTRARPKAGEVVLFAEQGVSLCGAKA